MLLKSIEDAELKGKKVIARFDFNVPLSHEGPDSKRTIIDTTRIDLALPTIRMILEKGASKLVLISHLGRPKGTVNPKFSLEPVAEYLANQLKTDVILTESAVDSGVKDLLQLPETKIVLLENIRFQAGEEKNDKELAEKLASYGDVFVNDAFGAAHRQHASTYGINAFFKNKAFAGLLLKKELESLSYLLNRPQKPFVGIIGGAKVSDKIKTIEKLLVLVDSLLIGGAMAYPFLKAKGIHIGKSLCSEEDVRLAQDILSRDRGSKIRLPVDHIIAQDPKDLNSKTTSSIEIPDDKMGLDIGSQTIENYKDVIGQAKTLFWNGPMGLFEEEAFSHGTMEMANMIASTSAYSVVGGGDSVAAVKKSGRAESFTHISTGGGASLEFIEKGELPGVRALKYGV